MAVKTSHLLLYLGTMRNTILVLIGSIALLSLTTGCGTQDIPQGNAELCEKL